MIVTLEVERESSSSTDEWFRQITVLFDQNEALQLQRVDTGAIEVLNPVLELQVWSSVY